ncbi:MAG: hypothetical protein AB7O24_05380 [Kofleriaceae bacterium]
MRKAPLAPTPAIEAIPDDDLADVNGGCKCKGSDEIKVQIGNPVQADVGAAPPPGGYGGGYGYAPPPPQPGAFQVSGGGGGGMSPAQLMMLLSMMSGSK